MGELETENLLGVVKGEEFKTPVLPKAQAYS